VAFCRLAIALAVLIGSVSARAEEACLDDQGELGEYGARKGVQKRPFLKRLRVEATVWGGFFAADLVSTSYNYGGAISFYPVEDWGFEASLVVTDFKLGVEAPLTQFFTGQAFQNSLAFVIVGNVLWSPIHLKMRAGERSIIHGDVFFVLGAGDTINPTAQGATFDVGIGLKLYPNKWVAIRLDIRDYLILQEAIAVQRVTNNIVGMLGISLFLPGPRGSKK
jgi:outer membrane beta-barrel protein